MEGVVIGILVLGVVWMAGSAADHIDSEYMTKRGKTLRFVNKTIVAGSIAMMGLGVIFNTMNI